MYAGIDRLRGEYTMAVFIRQGSHSFYADAMYRILYSRVLSTLKVSAYFVVKVHWTEKIIYRMRF